LSSSTTRDGETVGLGEETIAFEIETVEFKEETAGCIEETDVLNGDICDLKGDNIA
jgi:hypothetical protein